MLLRNVIGRPQQAHGVKSEQEYRQAARRFLLKHGLPPILTERDERPVAYVSDGRWVCDCDCGNGPSVSPEWGLAVCFECGSVWRPMLPEEWEEVERLLLARPHPRLRHFFPSVGVALGKGRMQTETVDDLAAENTAMGVM